MVDPFTSIHTFDVKQIIFNAQRQAALMIGECIKEMIIKTSNECLPLLREKLDELFNAITKIGVNFSPLKSQIEKYMESVNHLDVVQHTHSMKISPEVQSECLVIVASQIVDALNSKGVQTKHCLSLKVDLATLDAKQEALKKKLKQLAIQKERLYNSILEIDEIITNKQNDVSCLRKEHIIIAQTPVLIDVDVKTLETLQETLRTQCDELACLVWM